MRALWKGRLTPNWFASIVPLASCTHFLPKLRRFAFVAAGAFLLPAAALAQGTVQQSGVVTAGHGVIWLANGIIGDAGVPSTTPTIATNQITDGTLVGSYAARPLNGAASNGSYFSQSGNVSWFAQATNRPFTNAFGNQTTWLGNQFGGWWQAADTYSAVEIIGQPGAGIALAAATRSQDNTASQSYTQYIYCESDGTFNGSVTGRSCEDAYHFAWNRHDVGSSNGTHYAVGLEIDCENEETLVPQTPYALNNASFCGNLLLAAGGDYTNVSGRVSTPTSYAIGMATQNAGTSKFDAGIIAATNAFTYTHGPAADMADIVLLGANQALTWVDAAGSYVGVISSLSTAATAPMQMLFTNNGISFTDNAENQVIQLTPAGRILSVSQTIGTDTQAGVFPIMDGVGGSSRLWTVQDASATTLQWGARDATAGANQGDNFYIDGYSDAGVLASPLPTVNAPGSSYTGSSGTMTWSGSGCSTNPVLAVTAAAGIITGVTGVNTAGNCQTFPTDTATTWTAGGGLTGGSGASFNTSPTTTFLFHAMECVRAVGVCLHPQGVIAGGAIATNAAYGYLWGPTVTTTPTGTPNPPVAAVAYVYDTGTDVLNIYNPVSAAWRHIATSAGGG